MVYFGQYFLYFSFIFHYLFIFHFIIRYNRHCHNLYIHFRFHFHPYSHNNVKFIQPLRHTIYLIILKKISIISLYILNLQKIILAHINYLCNLFYSIFFLNLIKILQYLVVMFRILITFILFVLINYLRLNIVFISYQKSIHIIFRLNLVHLIQTSCSF